MPFIINVQVQRTGSVANGLKALLRQLEPKIERAVMAAAQVLLDASQKEVPQDTTVLVNDGHVRQEGSGLGTAGVVGYGTYGKMITAPDRNGVMQQRKPAQYAHFVHQGIFPSGGSPHNGKIHFLIDPSQSPAVHDDIVDAAKVELR